MFKFELLVWHKLNRIKFEVCMDIWRIYVKKKEHFLIGVVSSAERQWRGIPIWKLVVSLVDRDIQHGSFQSKFLPQEVLGHVYQPNATVHSQICEWEQVQLLPLWFTISRKIAFGYVIGSYVIMVLSGIGMCSVALHGSYSFATLTLGRNCEDIAMSFLVANATGAPPVWVQGQWALSALFHQEVKFFFLRKTARELPN